MYFVNAFRIQKQCFNHAQLQYILCHVIVLTAFAIINLRSDLQSNQVEILDAYSLVCFKF
jgi:hypothetical protein